MEMGSEWCDYNTGVLNIITKMSGLCYDDGPVQSLYSWKNKKRQFKAQDSKDLKLWDPAERRVCNI